MVNNPDIPTHIIIVAAGSGSRYGADRPKQFCELLGQPVLMHTIEAMRRALPRAQVTLVLAPAMFDYWHDLCREYGFDSPAVIAGGATRWHSVRNALSAVPDDAIVMVHDGARPVVNVGMVARLAEAAHTRGAAIPVVKVTDSLRVVDNHGGSYAVDRSAYRAVQTPQAFSAKLLKEAYQQPYSDRFTDDASVVEALGFIPALVDGDPHNIKITNPGDIALATVMLNSTDC